MQKAIDVLIDSATEGVRARHCWDANKAAKTLSLHPNRITVWWQSVEGRLIDLYLDQPEATTAMLSLTLARGVAERRRRQPNK